jgi:hypothetical protein
MTIATMLLALRVLVPYWATAGVFPSHHSVLVDAGQPACVSLATEARFVGFAYNHIVHVFNGCSVTETCTVSTNVNPEPQTVTVPSASRAEVLTFRGSPASAFTADVQCSP